VAREILYVNVYVNAFAYAFAIVPQPPNRD